MIARGWMDKDAVDALIDMPLLTLALGLVLALEAKNKVGLMTSPATSDLTRASCGPNHVHFAPGTYCLAASLVRAILQRGGDTWFFIFPDYAMGRSMVADATPVVAATGGKVLGSVAHPFPSQSDYSSYLLAAQSSGAKVICVCSAGTEVSDTIKQAHEFGLTGKGLILAAPFLGDSTFRAMGLDVAQESFGPRRSTGTAMPAHGHFRTGWRRRSPTGGRTRSAPLPISERCNTSNALPHWGSTAGGTAVPWSHR